MKYSLYEYWLGMNDPDATIRDAMSTRWIDAMKAYDRYFQSIKSELPEGLQEFDLHDAPVLHFSFSGEDSERTQLEICLAPSDGGQTILRLYEVSAYVLTKEEDTDGAYTGEGILCWGYDEIEKLDEGLWQLRVLFVGGAELQVNFRDATLEYISD